MVDTTAAFDMLTASTPFQQKVFELLGAKQRLSQNDETVFFVRVMELEGYIGLWLKSAG